MRRTARVLISLVVSATALACGAPPPSREGDAKVGEESLSPGDYTLRYYDGRTGQPVSGYTARKDFFFSSVAAWDDDDALVGGHADEPGTFFVGLRRRSTGRFAWLRRIGEVEHPEDTDPDAASHVDSLLRVGDDAVVATSTGRLYRLGGKDGKTVWSEELGVSSCRKEGQSLLPGRDADSFYVVGSAAEKATGRCVGALERRSIARGEMLFAWTDPKYPFGLGAAARGADGALYLTNVGGNDPPVHYLRARPSGSGKTETVTIEKTIVRGFEPKPNEVGSWTMVSISPADDGSVLVGMIRTGLRGGTSVTEVAVARHLASGDTRVLLDEEVGRASPSEFTFGGLESVEALPGGRAAVVLTVDSFGGRHTPPSQQVWFFGRDDQRTRVVRLPIGTTGIPKYEFDYHRSPLRVGSSLLLTGERYDEKTGKYAPYLADVPTGR